ncbi:FG-GAP-like repeat-containing protein [Rhodopirellula sallentina]|nr:FG-GAP-like repeat-containing protein [Rhodopirellula sallentina]
MSFWKHPFAENRELTPDVSSSSGPVSSTRNRRRQRVAKRVSGCRPTRRSRFELLELRQLLAAEIEPNDTIADATLLPAGELAEGALSSAGDVDFFRIDLAQGERFRLDPFNQNAPRFESTLPPGLELFDPDGNLLATSHDGSDLSVVAPSAGTYYLGISASNDFGTFVGDYGMQSTVFSVATNTEPEPNDPDSDAPEIVLGVPMNGSLDGGNDIDRFALSTQPGDVIVVSFAGLPDLGPATTLIDASGNVIATDITGNGITATSRNGGTVIVQLSRSDSSDLVSLPYNMIANVLDNAFSADDDGDTLSDAYDWQLARPSGLNDWQQQVSGTIDSISDVDVYRFEIDSLTTINFRLSIGATDSVTGGGKSMTLYNQYGQFLETTQSNVLNTRRPDAFDPGVYFLAVSANSPIGTGAYAISADFQYDFSPQRDATTHVFDFDQPSSYFGFDRVNDYAVDEARTYYIGSFDAKYAPYDVNAATEAPAEGNERVTQGIGDFGDFGAGGLGSSRGGQRSASGLAMTGATETTVNQLAALSTNTVNHEFGHAVGLPHARDVQAFMSYVGRTEYLSTGSIFSFEGTDSRQPGSEINNHRNYLDWVLQSGAQVIVDETRDADGNEIPVSLDRHLQEMSIDHRVSQTVELEARPVFVRAGDFNGDGRDDVTSLQQGSNQLHTYITADDGSLGEAVTTEITGTFNFATEPIAIADYNSDGMDDIALAMSGAAEVMILLAGAGGALTVATPLVTAGHNSAITAADFDGDGSTDIATVTFDGTLSTFINSGDGSFGEATQYTTVASPSSLDAGDIDGDGNVDLLVASNASASVSVHRNTSTGGFIRGDSVEITEFATGIAVADFNNDTAADFAVVSGEGALLEIYQSFANGQFGLLSSEVLTNEPHEISADDIDADGSVDLLVGGWRYSASVLLGDNEGGFTRPVWVSGTNWNEYSIVAADLDGSGSKELITADANNNALTVSRQSADNPENDKVVVFSSLEGVDDVDRYTFNPTGETVWDIDIDSAEFQMPLDAILTIRDASGAVIAQSDDEVDRQSGIASVDPYIRLDFTGSGIVPTGPLTIEVTGRNGSSASYRLKLTPGRAIANDAPRVIAVSPDNGAELNATNQILVLLDDIVDPSSIDSSTVRVVNASGQIVVGSAQVNPLSASLVWTAATRLPVGTYTLTLDGITDFDGNVLDGESDTNYAFPLVSGNGEAGGAFRSTFTITSDDVSPASVTASIYERDPYQRGRFTLFLSDQLSLASVHSTVFTLRGSGTDATFGTSDDTLLPLDAVYDTINSTRGVPLTLYTRGVPDSDRYRIEGRVTDAAGYTITLNEEVIVSGVIPATALFQDESLSTPGLVGSYVDQSLRGVSNSDDWRTTQTIAGTRVDPTVDFTTSGDFGTRADVGITSGSDEDWDNFSVQWDGYVVVPKGNVQLLTKSDDGSRVFIDLDRNGVFGNTAAEIADNGWGTGHGYIAGTPSSPLLAGMYPIRIQYEDGGGNEAVTLEWIRPNLAVDTDGLVHGPAIVGTSFAAGEHLTEPGLLTGSAGQWNSLAVTFSGAIDPDSLTTENLRLRRSDDSLFFENDDEFIEDSDGVIQWNPTTLTATLNFSQPLRAGYYLIEANGETGGITNTVGTLLDGEFLSNNIPGNSDTAVWNQTPSGDGIAGGTYRSTFSLSPQRLAVEIDDVLISENGGVTSVTVTRLYADTSDALVVSLSSSDRTELVVPPNVTIPAGAESVTFIANAVDDTLLDGTQDVVITASAAGLESGEGELGVTDYETLTMSLSSLSISERDGFAELILNRNDATAEQSISLSVDDSTEITVPTSVTFEAGQRTIRVPVSAIDDNLLDGTQFVSIVSSGIGLVDESIEIAVTDYETLLIDLDRTTASENGGTITGILHRSASDGSLSAQIFSDPSDALQSQILVSFPEGSTTSSPFELVARDNRILDGTRAVSLIASAGGYESTAAEIEITDHEPLEIVFDSPDANDDGVPQISEKDGVAVIRVRRTDNNGILEAHLTTAPANSLSFASAAQFADGEFLSEPIEVAAIDDDLLTGTRNVVLRATATDYVDAETSLDITDYEELTTRLVRQDGSLIIDNTVPEDSETIYLRVELPGVVSLEQGSQQIAIATSAPQSIELPDTAFVAIGDSFVDIPVTPINNDIVGGDRDLEFFVSSDGYESSQLPMTVTEDDVPEMTAELVLPATQTGTPINSIPEHNGRATLVLTRNTTSEVTVRLSTSPNDQMQWPASIMFPRGQRRIEIPITTEDNNVVEGNRQVTVSIRATGHPTVEVSTTVADDEEAAMSIVDDEGNPVSETVRLFENAADGSDSQTLGVSLASAPLSDVRVAVNAPDRIGIEVNDDAINILTFTPFDWDQPQPVRLFVHDDDAAGGDETFTVDFDVIDTQSDEQFRNIPPQTVTLTTIDDDVPSILVTETFENTYASELGLPADSFAISLGARPTGPVTLSFDNGDIGSVNLVPASLTFTPENWNLEQTVSVQTDLDFDADGHDIGLIYIDVAPSTTAFGYPSIGRRRLSVVHVDAQLSDLHVRRVDDDIVLVDETTETTLLTRPVSASTFTTGLRGETISIDHGIDAGTINLNTSGGDDNILINAISNASIDGDAGYDALHLNIDGFHYQPIDATGVTSTGIIATNMEEINTLGDGTQTLTINSTAVRQMTDSRNTLFLRVDPDDVLDLGTEWTVETPVERDGIPAHQLSSGDTILQLAASVIWQNPLLAPDVNRSGDVSALDPLLIINRLNNSGEGELPEFSSVSSAVDTYYYDVSGDGLVTALDALQTINYLNTMDLAPAAAEPVFAASSSTTGVPTRLHVSSQPTAVHPILSNDSSLEEPSSFDVFDSAVGSYDEKSPRVLFDASNTGDSDSSIDERSKLDDDVSDADELDAVFASIDEFSPRV